MTKSLFRAFFILGDTQSLSNSIIKATKWKRFLDDMISVFDSELVGYFG